MQVDAVSIDHFAPQIQRHGFRRWTVWFASPDGSVHWAACTSFKACARFAKRKTAA